MIIAKWMKDQQAYAQATGQKYADFFEQLDEVVAWWLDEPQDRFQFRTTNRKPRS
jgi:hypothetical protein